MSKRNFCFETEGVGEKKPLQPFNEHENLHFVNEWGIYMSSKINEESGTASIINMLTILY
jgi:hypothetical protein